MENQLGEKRPVIGPESECVICRDATFPEILSFFSFLQKTREARMTDMAKKA